MKLESRQIALIANALALAAETYERHHQNLKGIEDQLSIAGLGIAEQFRWQAETARELSSEFMLANDVIIEGDE